MVLNEAVLDHSLTTTHIGPLQGLICPDLWSHSAPSKGDIYFFIRTV